MTITILATRAFALPELEARGEALRVIPLGDPGGEGARAVLSSAVDRIDADTIASLPQSVGLIANFGVGTDNVDLAAARARGIRVSNTPVVTEDTADLAFALILAASRRVVAADRFVRDGRWGAGAAFDLAVRVHGARLGLAGFGAIGQAVARRAMGFGMDISYWARKPRPEAAQFGARFVESLEALAAEADILSLHVPLTKETHHLVDAALLGGARKGLIFVNTGRGKLVDESALVAALESGQVAAAGLDVFEAEPNVHPALTAMSQVVLTPHIGSATGICRAEMTRRMTANVIAFLETGSPLDPVV